MISAITLLGALTLAVIGWGAWIRSRFERAAGAAPRNASGDVIVGLYLALLLGQVSPFLVANGYRTGLLYLAGGISLFAWLRVGRIPSRRWIAQLSALSVFVFVVWSFASHVQAHYDAGLYHFAFVRWISERGTVLGLANLNSRFGYNSSWLAASALFAKGPHWHWGPIIWSVTLTILLYGALLYKAAWAFRGGRPMTFAFSLLAASLVWLLPGQRGFDFVTQTDMPATMLVLHALAAALSLIEAPETDKREYLPLAAAIASAATVKISSAPVGLLWAIVLMDYLRRCISFRELLPAFVVLVALPVFWIGQNLALSGCLAFPVAFTCFNLPWGVGTPAAVGEAAWIASWARKPLLPPTDPIFSNFRWLADWSGLHMRLLLTAGALIVAGGALFAAGHLSGQRRGNPQHAMLPITVAFAGQIAWFLSAPDPRFGAGFIIGFVALVLATGASIWPKPIGLLVAAAILKYEEVPHYLQHIFTKPGTTLLAEGLPQPKLETKVTTSGLTLYVPRLVDGEDRCWAAQPLCTSSFNEHLSTHTLGPYQVFFIARAGDRSGSR